MTTIESKTIIKRPVTEIYQFLADFNNHSKLMPENIYNWVSTTDDATFTIQNMAKLSLKISERVLDKSITAIPSEKPPFDLQLNWILNPVNTTETAVTMTIIAELNMMLKMLASGPLQKIADYNTSQLKHFFQ